MKKLLKEEIKEWSEKVQVDENLRTLSDIRVIINFYWEKGYSLSWEVSDLISKIEEIINECKEKNDVVLLIKKEIKEFFEKQGRLEDFTHQNKDVLIKEIILILDTFVKIPSNYLVISKLKYEDFLNEKM